MFLYLKGGFAEAQRDIFHNVILALDISEIVWDM